jgi:hypothetical protein
MNKSAPIPHLLLYDFQNCVRFSDDEDDKTIVNVLFLGENFWFIDLNTSSSDYSKTTVLLVLAVQYPKHFENLEIMN